MEKHPVEKLAEAVGGTIKEVGALPDGSGFATMSMPLPKNHWIYGNRPDGFNSPPPMPFRMGSGNPLRHEWTDKVREAAQYAVRGATMCGKEDDFDPDALVQNLIVGLFGYWTSDGLTDDAWANPDPVPPLFTPPAGSGS